MYIPTVLLALAAAISAVPTSPNDNNPLSSPAKRTCAGVQYPELRTSPTQSIPFPISISSSASPVEIGFTIPDDAVGPCSLMLSLPAGTAIQGGAQINVVALDGPSPGSLVGTTNFMSGSQATINSFACRAQMCYSLQIANGDGSVEFMETRGVGMTMTYDC